MIERMIEKRIGDIRLVGNSRGGEESVIAAPELNVCFDIGLAPREVLSVDYVCLTHGHADHAAGIHYYFSQRVSSAMRRVAYWLTRALSSCSGG